MAVKDWGEGIRCNMSVDEEWEQKLQEMDKDTLRDVRVGGENIKKQSLLCLEP